MEAPGHVPAVLWGSSLLVFSLSEFDEGALPLEDSRYGPGVNDGAPRSPWDYTGHFAF